MLRHGAGGPAARTIPFRGPECRRVRVGSFHSWSAMLPVLVALWLGMGLILATGTNPTGLPGYRVRGMALAHDIAAERESAYDCEVLVISCRWQINAIAHHFIYAPRLRISAVYDRESLCHLMHHHAEFTSVEVPALPIPDWDHWFGTIWLAYCSGAYLAGQKTNWLPLPVIMYALAGQPTIDVIAGLAARQETDWRAHQRLPGVPEWFVSLCAVEILVASTYGAEWIGERYLPRTRRALPTACCAQLRSRTTRDRTCLTRVCWRSGPLSYRLKNVGKSGARALGMCWEIPSGGA